MITTNLIIEAMDLLSGKRRLFWSEADFQFSLAQVLRCVVPNGAQIYLERPIANIMEAMQEDNNSTNRKKCYIDIWIHHDGKVYPIELKYATKKSEVEDLDKQIIRTVDQFAYDITRFGYLYDIHRIEQIKKFLTKAEGLEFGRGFAIILTNDQNYYYKKPNHNVSKTLDAKFRLHSGATPPKKVEWTYEKEVSPKHWTKTQHPYCDPFMLPDTLNLDWRQYGKEEGVKYLINVI